MHLFIGLDVSLEETSICVVDANGKIRKELKAATDPDALFAAIEPFKDRVARVGFEACALSSWLHIELKGRGLPAIVVEATHMRAAIKAQGHKTDRNDAKGIANMMRLGWYKPVHVKSPESQRLRVLLSNRRLLKRKLVDIENHIRGTLRSFGLKLGKVGRGGFEERVRELMEGKDAATTAFISTMLAVRRGVWDGYVALHNLLIEIVKNDPICRRFMTVPGVGPIAALSFRAGVDDPLRFTKSRTVGAHFGLTPKVHQSGTIAIDGHITKRGDADVRTALCEAAASLLMRVKKWSALKVWGLRIVQRSSMMNAVVAVARKMAIILHRMWMDCRDFSISAGAAVVEKRRLTGSAMV
ncbi:MAG: IS110 family transposase [Hyphomicrobiaceae bacterium]|nr:IS110 family transposase [Hyphomicrobiaceae bacterium]